MVNLENFSNGLPYFLKQEYPFVGSYFTLKTGQKMHYIDSGDKQAPVVVMVHGNPTWSFYYRNLISVLSKFFRVIAPDHLGCGLSDKDQDYDYTLKNHIQNLKNLLEGLHIFNFDLVVHDWGGPIGLGASQYFSQRDGGIVILNTAAFIDSFIPKRISICRIPFLGEKFVRYFNAFAWPATFMAVQKSLTYNVKKGYLWPYHNYYSRIATARFVKDIPMKKSDTSYSDLLEVERNLKGMKGKKCILWGMKDFCFTPHFLKRWKEIYPEAEVKEFSNGGHYILEDEKDEVISTIESFLKGNQ